MRRHAAAFLHPSGTGHAHRTEAPRRPGAARHAYAAASESQPPSTRKGANHGKNRLAKSSVFGAFRLCTLYFANLRFSGRGPTRTGDPLGVNEML
jgi:hypothetical protein